MNITVELLYYILLVSVGVFFIFKELESERVYFFTSLFLFTLYSFIIRYSGFEKDIIVYAQELHTTALTSYYLKEPLYWLGSRLIYEAIDSKELTFVVFDLMSFILILKARKIAGLPQFFPYLFVLFFPSVMGLNNVYRQYLAICLFVYSFAISINRHSPFKSGFFLLLAILTHNVMALFAPLYFLSHKNGIKKIILSSIFICLTFPLFLSTKSNSETGQVGDEIYIILLLIFIVFYLFSLRLKLKLFFKSYFVALLSIFFILITSSVTMGLTQSKRVGMCALVISLIPMIKSISISYKQKKIVFLLMYIILVLPTFLFPNAFILLLTSSSPY